MLPSGLQGEEREREKSEKWEEGGRRVRSGRREGGRRVSSGRRGEGKKGGEEGRVKNPA